MKVLIVSNDRALLRHVSRFLATFGYERHRLPIISVPSRLPIPYLPICFWSTRRPISTGAQSCRAASGRNGTEGHYVVLMVDQQSQARLLDAVEAGADDCVSKPIVYGEVLMRLRAGARAVEFQRRTRQQRRREPVTGLLTSAAFRARLQAAGASRASRNGRLVCATFEIDFIEQVTRSMGRQTEQELLKEVGSLLDKLCDNDRAELAHFGNGRFCVMLPGSTIDETVRWCENVRREIAGREFQVDGSVVALTVSAGIGGADTLTMSPEAILDRSLLSLKTAKASGHDCVVQANQFADEETAWKELAVPGRLFEQTVARDVMVPCTIPLGLADSLRSAESLFRQTHLASMVVLDGTGHLAGAVYAEDLAEYLQSSGDPDQPVSKLMERDVEVVEENASFADVMRLFAQRDIDLVVVVDQGHPTGIVTAASLASLSQAPEPPAFCTETPVMGSSYLQVAEPLALQGATDTV